MGNYVIEDEIHDYSDNYVAKKRNNYINKKYLLIGIIALILVLIVVFIVKNNKSNSYSYYEKKLVTSAKEYVNNNSVSTNKDIYIDVSKLNMNLPNSCSLLSGVIYDGNNYIPYLLCNNYESEIISNELDGEIKIDFKLIGNDVVVLLKGMEYYELGYESSELVNITSNNINDEGVYNIYYTLEDSGLMFTRKVIVIDNPSLKNMFPAINVNNENPIMIEKGNSYNENVTAVDSIDGDLTDKIITVSNVEINTTGEYRVIYSVENSLGYTTSIEKKVLVVDSLNSEMDIITSLSNDNITNESIKVNVKVLGNEYDYTKLPDGTTTNEKEFEYPINENGEYEFIAVSKDENEVNKVLNITNIDKTIPEGTCLATLYNDKTSISVTMKSFNYVVGYDYYVDNVSSGYSASSFYNSSKINPSEIYVIAKDYVGNEGKIVCTKNEKQSNMNPNGITTLLNRGARIRQPISEMLARKGYTVNDLNMCIYNRVKDAGPYTRYGVVAAAYGLIDCTNSMIGAVMSYDHEAGRTDDAPANGGTYCTWNPDICGKLGINTRWGVQKNNTCTSASTQCWYGLNCATFVRWSMCNGGMNLCKGGSKGAYSMTSKENFADGSAVNVYGKKVEYLWGKDMSNYTAEQLVRMIKPGDILARYEPKAANSNATQHTCVVVGITDNYIVTANDGYYMERIYYSSMVAGKYSYRLVFLDNYYANPANRNNLYN